MITCSTVRASARLFMQKRDSWKNSVGNCTRKDPEQFEFDEFIDRDTGDSERRSKRTEIPESLSTEALSGSVEQLLFKQAPLFILVGKKRRNGKGEKERNGKEKKSSEEEEMHLCN